MAMFRQHVSLGAVVAAIGVVCAYYYAFVTDWQLLALLFTVTVFASFLPDLDSDSGLPFHLIFGSFTVLVAGVVLYDTLLLQPDSTYELIGRPLVTLLLVWFVGGSLFKHLTTHRGMMHSLPAALIVGMAAFLITNSYTASHLAAIAVALGASAGFVSHLVLDEIYADVSSDGVLFTPKHSLGTALKFFSSSTLVNLVTYCALIILTYRVLALV